MYPKCAFFERFLDIIIMTNFQTPNNVLTIEFSQLLEQKYSHREKIIQDHFVLLLRILNQNLYHYELRKETQSCKSGRQMSLAVC